MSWSTFVQKGNVSIWFLIPLSATGACLIFFPLEWKQKLSIEAISRNYSTFIGPIFLITSILLIINIIVMLFSSISNLIHIVKIKRFIQENIENLSQQEKAVMREFYILGNDTIPLPFQNAIVVGLVSKRIIFQIGNQGEIYNGNLCFSYAITQKAKKLISPQLIDLPINPTNEDRISIASNRPNFVKNYY